jgi:hypothetical protein
MSVFTPTGVRIEELGAAAMEAYLVQVPALVPLFKAVTGDEADKPVDVLSVRVKSAGERPLGTGVHTLEFQVELLDSAEDDGSETIRSYWAAIVGAVYQKNLAALLTQYVGFFCYGVIRKPTVQDVSGGRYHKMVSFSAPCIERVPS